MLICIPVYIKGQKALSLLWLSDLTEVGSPMISRVNNDVTLGLVIGQPPCDITVSLCHLATTEREPSDLCVYTGIHISATYTQ